MVKDIQVKNFATYKKYLKSLIGEESLMRLLDSLGGDEKVMNASFGMTKNSGTAYDGAMVELSLEIGRYTSAINDLLPEGKRVEPSKIYKVALLSHVSKVVMYQENLNEWEKQNRGILYTFTNREIMLKGGELSTLICMNCGIKFEDDEFEAMRILDKLKEEGTNCIWGSSTLAMIIRQANEIISNIRREA